MLRGSYAGGSPNVTARCPCRRSGPAAHPACPRPGSSSRMRRFPISLPTLRQASLSWTMPPPFTALLLLCASVPLFAIAWRSRAKQSLRVSSRSFSSPRHRRASLGIAKHIRRFAALCRSVASRTLRCFASPPLSRGASPQLLIAFQSHRTATPRKASPSLPASVHRRCTPRLCFAVALHSAALRRGAVAVRGPSWPSYPMPLRVGSLPVLRGAVRFVAPPSPIAPPRCSTATAQRHSKPSHAADGIALPCHARPRSAYPSPI